MTLCKIAKALEPLEYLKKLFLPYSKLRQIRVIRELVAPEAEMCREEESKLIFEHIECGVDGPLISEGKITYKSLQDRFLFEEKIEELHNMEISLNIEPVSITITDMGDQKISEEYITNLKGFIEFGGD